MKKYYIMGSAIHYENIRKCFEAEGFNPGKLDCSDEYCMYYTTDKGDILCTHHPGKQRAIMEDPDYQELPLGIEEGGAQ